MRLEGAWLVRKSYNGTPMRSWMNSLSRSGFQVLNRGRKPLGHKVAREHLNLLSKEEKFLRLLLLNGLILILSLIKSEELQIPLKQLRITLKFNRRGIITQLQLLIGSLGNISLKLWNHSRKNTYM